MRSICTIPEQEFVIENLRQEANAFNWRALISLRIIVGLSCIMYDLFRLHPPLPSSFFFLVSSCSIISRITLSLRKNPCFPLLCVSYLALHRFSFTTFSCLISQVSFVSIFITTNQYPMDSSTRFLCWPRPHLYSLKSRGRLAFGGHTRLS